MSAPFRLEFATPVWAELGRLGVAEFDELLETLEHYAALSSVRLRSGAAPQRDGAVPIVAGPVIAECAFDDFHRSITVLHVERCERPRRAG